MRLLVRSQVTICAEASGACGPPSGPHYTQIYSPIIICLDKYMEKRMEPMRQVVVLDYYRRAFFVVRRLLCDALRFGSFGSGNRKGGKRPVD